MRYLVWIAEFRESSRSWTQSALRGYPFSTSVWESVNTKIHLKWGCKHPPLQELRVCSEVSLLGTLFKLSELAKNSFLEKASGRIPLLRKGLNFSKSEVEPFFFLQSPTLSSHMMRFCSRFNSSWDKAKTSVIWLLWRKETRVHLNFWTSWSFTASDSSWTYQ